MSLLEEAIAYHRSGKIDDATTRYRQVIASDPSHHQACHLLALLLQQTGDIDGACALIQQAIFTNPTDAQYRLSFGELLHGMGMHSEAEVQFSVAVALNPGNAELHNRLGKCLFARKAYVPAKDAFYQAITIDPKCFGALNNLAVALFTMAEYKDAIQYLEEITRQTPDRYPAWNNLGSCWRALEKTDEAERCYRIALSLAPSDAEIYVNLIRLLREGERNAEALALAEQGMASVRSGDMQDELIRTHAEIAREQGLFEISKAGFRRLLEQTPDALSLQAETELSFTSRSATDYYSLGDIPPVQGSGIKRVAVFAPNGDSYLNLLWGLKRAFERAGKQCVVGWPLLPPEGLQAFIAQFSPDLIVEINRTRHQAKVVPSHIKHVSWIQDGTLAFDQDINLFGGSERTYFMALPEALGYPAELLQQTQHFGLLIPAADPDVYHPGTPSEFRYDCLFAGYIPAPPEANRKTTLFRKQERWELSSAELESLFRAAGIFQWSVGDCAYRMIHQRLCEHLKLTPDELRIPNTEFMLITELMRTMDRKDLLDQTLDVTKALLLNGPKTWMEWPRFAPHYGGMLHDAKALSSSYRSSRLILHNGVSALHPRTFEVLACGGVLLINRCYSDDQIVSIKRYLTADEHYIEYALPEARSAIESALSSPARLTDMRKAARAAFLQGHTWDHRVKQILSEI